MTSSVKGFWLLVLMWFILSCYGLFLRTPSGATPSINHFDKVAHFVMFFGQFYLLGVLLNAKSKVQIWRLWCLGLMWAVLSELIQGYFTTRTMDVWDGVADMGGVTAALGVLYQQGKQKSNSLSSAPIIPDDRDDC